MEVAKEKLAYIKAKRLYSYESRLMYCQMLLQTKGEKAHGFNRGMIAPKMCVYNLNKHLQIYYNVRYEERIQTHKNDCILN